MTADAAAALVIGGDPAQLEATGRALREAGQRARELGGGAGQTISDTVNYWTGRASESFRTNVGLRTSLLVTLAGPLGAAAAAYLLLAQELRAAQDTAADAMSRSRSLGLGEGDLVGRPAAVAAFVTARPGQRRAVEHLLGEVVGARSRANDARDRFVTSMNDVQTRVTAADRRGGERRDPDGRGGGRVLGDRLTGRPEGGRGDGHLNNDWAGRAILGRYLSGGGDWTIVDDPNWSRYMMANQHLNADLTARTEQQARDAVANYLAGGGSTSTFNEQFHADVQNGEGIVGYQYLHGTNATVGDFQMRGNTTVTPLSDGNYQVRIDGGYTWNDVIDPNPKYATDRWKSTLAEILTLGQADAYNIHITWHGTQTLVVDPAGNVMSTSGYPAP